MKKSELIKLLDNINPGVDCEVIITVPEYSPEEGQGYDADYAIEKVVGYNEEINLVAGFYD